MNDKIAIQKLEDYDTLRVSAKLKEYGLDVANRVYAVLPDHISSFGAFIDLRVEIDSFRPTHPDEVGKLISISIDWPPSQAPVMTRHPINVTSFSVTKGDVPIQSAALVVHDADLSITAHLEELSATPGKLTICVSTPSLYFLLPGQEPFRRHLFNLNLTIYNGTDKTLLYLDHSAKVSLRCRKDNSEYQSLAYSVRSDQIRKITFFSANEIHVRHYFGLNQRPEFMRVVNPLYAAGISLLAGSITFALIQANFTDIAASAFALLILPPFLQVLSQRSLFYPSSDIMRLSVSTIVLFLVGTIYLPLLVATIAILVAFSQYRLIAQRTDLGAGLLLVGLATTYAFLLEQGLFQHYACDRCERRLWWRKRAKLDLDSRQTLCNECWKSTQISSRAL